MTLVISELIMAKFDEVALGDLIRFVVEFIVVIGDLLSCVTKLLHRGA